MTWLPYSADFRCGLRCATQRDHVFHPEMNYSQTQLDQLDRSPSGGWPTISRRARPQKKAKNSSLLSIIGIVQNAGTPSRLRFARTRRDERPPLSALTPRGRFLRGLGPRLRMKLMVIPVGRSLFLKSQLSQPLRPVLKRFAGRLARYAYIDILKTSSAEEENILGNVALSPPAEEESILASVTLPYVVK